MPTLRACSAILLTTALAACTAADRDPGAPYVDLGNHLMDAHQPEKAEAAFREALRRDPRNAAACVGVARALGDQKKYTEELAAAREAVARFPNDPAAAYQLAFALGDNNQQEEGIKAFQRVLQLDPKYPHVHVQLSWTYLQLGENARAVDEARAEGAADPKYAFGYKQLGDALTAIGKVEESIPVYEKAAELDPQDPWALKSISDRYNTLDRYPDAVRTLEKALARFPGNRTLLIDYATALQKVGRATEAPPVLVRAQRLAEEELARDPRDVSAQNGIGVALEYQGKLDDARAAYEKVLQMPDLFADDRALALSNIASILTKQHKYAEVPSYRRQVYELTKRPANLREWGVAEFCAGNDAQALSLLVRAAQELGADTQSGRYAAIYAHLVALKSGDKDTAARQLALAATAPTDAWPAPAVEYLQGKRSADDALARAADNDQRTEANAYIGFHRVFTGDNGGLQNLRWVAENGVPYYVETDLVKAYLSRQP
jgi:tetratricopeptide (TPR) repeat protein